MAIEVPVFPGRDDGYTIYVGSDILDSLGTLAVRARLGRRAFVISNTTVAPLYLERVIRSLRSNGFTVGSHTVPDGEAQKNWDRAGELLDACVSFGLERSSFIVALGGGVVGDLAGFVASVYMRGIPFVQVPTTLLAQVDASVGGKVAVNHPGGKNLLGSFHQPSLVLADIKVLNTLPDRELSAGMAEVVKHGLIRDPKLYDFVSENTELFQRRDAHALERVVVDSCRIKAAVVARDEKELGERAVLNYGHTVGHAIEAAAGYGTYTHGEAVGIGMVAEMILSTEYGQVSMADVDRLVGVLHALNLPTQPKPGLTELAMKYLLRDKKVQEGRLRLALLQRIGWANVTDSVAREQVESVVQALEEDRYSVGTE